MKIRLSIGKRIGIGFGILILATFIAFFLTRNTLEAGRKKIDKVTEVYTPSVDALEELNNLIIRSKTLITSWVYIASKDDSPDKESLRRLIKEEFPKVKGKIQKLSLNWQPEEKTQIDTILAMTEDLFSFHQEIMLDLNSFESYDDPFTALTTRGRIEEGDVFEYTRNILIRLSFLTASQQVNAGQESKQMLNSFDRLDKIIFILGIALLLAGIIITFLTVSSIVKPVRHLRDNLLHMSRGILNVKPVKKRYDEIGEMAFAQDTLASVLNRTARFAHELGSGNFESDYKPLSDEDIMGHALLKMRDELHANEQELERKVRERTKEVVKQKVQIEAQKEKISVLYEQTTDSIRYAKRIQEAILPPDRLVKILLPSSFILYKPKDIVSGDFYWITRKNHKVYFSAIDCTGHGVPGAFMSIVGYNLLNTIIERREVTTPAMILDELSKGIQQTLRQGQSDDTAKDGMDLAFCSLDQKNMKLEYAGAYNPLYIIRNGELLEVKADKFPIGFDMFERDLKFSNNEIDLQKGDMLYIFSDGYVDQFGGPKGKKFMSKRFKELLMKIAPKPPEEQRTILDQAIEEWKGKEEQVDDIIVIGVRV